jgi:hypothetical protein
MTQRVETDRPVRDFAAFFFRAISLMMKAMSTSETVVSFYITARCKIPEVSFSCSSPRENLTFYRTLNKVKWQFEFSAVVELNVRQSVICCLSGTERHQTENEFLL